MDVQKGPSHSSSSFSRESIGQMWQYDLGNWQANGNTRRHVEKYNVRELGEPSFQFPKRVVDDSSLWSPLGDGFKVSDRKITYQNSAVMMEHAPLDPHQPEMYRFCMNPQTGETSYAQSWATLPEGWVWEDFWHSQDPWVSVRFKLDYMKRHGKDDAQAQRYAESIAAQLDKLRDFAGNEDVEVYLGFYLTFTKHFGALDFAPTQETLLGFLSHWASAYKNECHVDAFNNLFVPYFVHTLIEFPKLMIGEPLKELEKLLLKIEKSHMKTDPQGVLGLYLNGFLKRDILTIKFSKHSDGLKSINLMRMVEHWGYAYEHNVHVEAFNKQLVPFIASLDRDVMTNSIHEALRLTVFPSLFTFPKGVDDMKEKLLALYVNGGLGMDMCILDKADEFEPKFRQDALIRILAYWEMAFKFNFLIQEGPKGSVDSVPKVMTVTLLPWLTNKIKKNTLRDVLDPRLRKELYSLSVYYVGSLNRLLSDLKVSYQRLDLALALLPMMEHDLKTYRDYTPWYCLTCLTGHGSSINQKERERVNRLLIETRPRLQSFVEDLSKDSDLGEVIKAWEVVKILTRMREDLKFKMITLEAKGEDKTKGDRQKLDKLKRLHEEVTIDQDKFHKVLLPYLARQNHLFLKEVTKSGDVLDQQIASTIALAYLESEGIGTKATPLVWEYCAQAIREGHNYYVTGVIEGLKEYMPAYWDKVFEGASSDPKRKQRINDEHARVQVVLNKLNLLAQGPSPEPWVADSFVLLKPFMEKLVEQVAAKMKKTQKEEDLDLFEHLLISFIDLDLDFAKETFEKHLRAILQESIKTKKGDDLLAEINTSLRLFNTFWEHDPVYAANYFNKDLQGPIYCLVQQGEVEKLIKILAGHLEVIWGRDPSAAEVLFESLGIRDWVLVNIAKIVLPKLDCLEKNFTAPLTTLAKDFQFLFYLTPFYKDVSGAYGRYFTEFFEKYLLPLVKENYIDLFEKVLGLKPDVFPKVKRGKKTGSVQKPYESTRLKNAKFAAAQNLFSMGIFLSRINNPLAQRCYKLSKERIVSPKIKALREAYKKTPRALKNIKAFFSELFSYSFFTDAFAKDWALLIPTLKAIPAKKFTKEHYIMLSSIRDRMAALRHEDATSKANKKALEQIIAKNEEALKPLLMLKQDRQELVALKEQEPALKERQVKVLQELDGLNDLKAFILKLSNLSQEALAAPLEARLAAVQADQLEAKAVLAEHQGLTKYLQLSIENRAKMEEELISTKGYTGALKHSLEKESTRKPRCPINDKEYQNLVEFLERVEQKRPSTDDEDSSQESPALRDILQRSVALF